MTIILINSMFLKDSFSLKKKTLNNIVVKGTAKNNKLVIKGLVCFRPKKLNNSAKKITTLISSVRLKYVFK